ncbi:unnamed protein product [Didymodactylos carnosus]|uniref:Uncharacterized protein n=1 Tax=Didymodactylos carnosus TaxID=1234261 RepID=A0A813NNN2_9BILA|nr:unnamed protein product [Didymodactylos carnosus]CAF3516061.1 unnamed protein product [Didymodactylos carnosus]
MTTATTTRTATTTTGLPQKKRNLTWIIVGSVAGGLTLLALIFGALGCYSCMHTVKNRVQSSPRDNTIEMVVVRNNN